MIAPGFGGINLEDIAAPRCFEIEAPAARVARHPGLPRRPARHRDRRAGRAHQRAALRRQGARRRPDRGRRRRRRRYGDRHAAARRRARRRRGLGPRGLPVRDDDACRPAKAELAGRTNPRGLRGDLRDGARGRRRLHRRQRARASSTAEWINGHGRRPGRLRPGQPRPGDRPGRGRQHAAVVASGRWTTPTRSTTCWPSPASSAACSTPGPRRSPSRCCCGRRRDRAGRHRRGAQRQLHHPQRLPPRRAQEGRAPPISEGS